MKNLNVLLVLVLSCAVTACRQPDAPVPSPPAYRDEEIADVVQDLLNVSRSRKDSPEELVEDLVRFGQEDPAAQKAAAAFGRQVASVLANTKLAEPDAQQLAHTLWLVTAARDASERQITAMGEDLKATLISIGVSEAGAQTASAQVALVQRVVNKRPRRWYELF